MKRLNLVLIASIFAVFVLLAPACAMELNHSSDISLDNSISVDNAIPVDININDGSAVDDGIPSDIPCDHNGSDGNVIPSDNIVPGDDGSMDNVIPIDNVVPGGDDGSMDNVIPIDNIVPSDVNGSDGKLMPIDNMVPSDINESMDEAIINEVPDLAGIGDSSASIIDNYHEYKNTDSMDCKISVNDDYIDKTNKVQSDISLKNGFEVIDLSYNTLPLDNLKDYEKIIFDRVGVRNSSIESENDILKYFMNDSILEVKKTIDFVDLNSSSKAMNIRVDHSLSLDIGTIDKDDSLLRVNLNDSIFANLLHDDSMGNKRLVKDLTPVNCPNLCYFSSDKTFKKCVKTHIFKVRNIRI